MHAAAAHNPPMTRPRWSSTTKRAVVLALAVLGVFLLWRTSPIVLPFVWAAVLSYVLMPAVNALERRGLRRTLAATVVFLALVATIIGLSAYAIPLAFHELRDLQRSYPRLIETAAQSITAAVEGTPFDQLDDLILGAGMTSLLESVPRLAVPFAVAVGHFLIEFVMFLIGTFFFLRDAPKLKRWAQRLIPPSQRRDLLPLLGQVSALLGRYVRGQIILVFIMAAVTTIGLTLMGVPYAFVLGLLTGVLETIPIVGPITAGGIAVLVALGHQNPFAWPQLWYAAAVAILYTVLRHAEDYFIIPLVIGRIVLLHPAVVIFSLLAGGTVAGLLGVLLAVPFAATARLVLIYVNAKLRDEDPFPRLEEELAAASEPVAEGAHQAHPVGGSAHS